MALLLAVLLLFSTRPGERATASIREPSRGVQDMAERIGRLAELTAHTMGCALEMVMSGERSRRRLGELMLEHVLRDSLPPDAYRSQVMIGVRGGVCGRCWGHAGTNRLQVSPCPSYERMLGHGTQMRGSGAEGAVQGRAAKACEGTHRCRLEVCAAPPWHERHCPHVCAYGGRVPLDRGGCGHPQVCLTKRGCALPSSVSGQRSTGWRG